MSYVSHSRQKRTASGFLCGNHIQNISWYLCFIWTDTATNQGKIMNQDLNLWLSKYMIWEIYSANRTLLLTLPYLNRLKSAAFVKKFHCWVHWIQVDIKT